MDNQNTDNAVVEEVVHPQTETTEAIETSENVENSESVETEVAPVAEETAQSQEENAKFADVRRKAEQDARVSVDEIQEKLNALQSSPSLKFVEKQAKKNNMDVSTYLEAVQKQEEYDVIQSIADTENVSIEVANKLYKATQLEERVQTETLTKQQQAAEDADLEQFVTKYPDVKDLPDEVRKAWVPGTKLTEIYKDYEFNQMKSKISEYESKQQVQNQNLENSEASTGSVAGNGAVTGGLTEAMIDKMSPKELMKRWPEVKKLTGMK